MLAHRCHMLRYKSNRVPAWCDRISCAHASPLLVLPYALFYLVRPRALLFGGGGGLAG
jgi:hypothetical protein